MLLSGWGRYPVCESELKEPGSLVELQRQQAERAGFVARGNGRAYGDAAIGSVYTTGMKRLDRMRAFEPETGRLTVEAGVLLSDIIACFLPRGFFPPVVPGTKFVTVGGMIAADVHGKNHHRAGGFGEHVERLSVLLPSGEALTCSRDENADFFFATVGGMGLTGTILEATFRLTHVQSSWIRQEVVVAPNLDAAMAALSAGDKATYSVAWIDCLARGASLGRSLVYLGEHATSEEATLKKPDQPLFAMSRRSRLSVPMDFPNWALNPWSMGAFNATYFRRGVAKAGTPFLSHWDGYFFPLDAIGDWNRIYGRRGFLQHQCVIPLESSREVLGEILERVSARGTASFLAVLKKLGPAKGQMSFPMPGFTLTLDFAVTDSIFPFLDEIDAIVTRSHGRIYLAKDARQSRATFEAGYPGLGNFRAFRRTIDPHEQIKSQLSQRLGI